MDDLEWKVVVVYVVGQWLTLQVASAFGGLVPALEIFEDDEDKRYIPMVAVVLVGFQVGFGFITFRLVGSAAWTLVPVGTAVAYVIGGSVWVAIASFFGGSLISLLRSREAGQIALAGGAVYAAVVASGLLGVFLAQSAL